jgi:hypothetical protein
MVAVVLKHGADPNLSYASDGQSPLYIAVPHPFTLFHQIMITYQ